MDIVQLGPVISMIVGAVAAVCGWLAGRRGRSLLLVGAAFMIGSLSPLAKGQLAESARILLSIASMALSAAAVVVVILDFRRPVQPPYRRRSVRPEITLNLE